MKDIITPWTCGEHRDSSTGGTKGSLKGDDIIKWHRHHYMCRNYFNNWQCLFLNMCIRTKKRGLDRFRPKYKNWRARHALEHREGSTEKYDCSTQDGRGFFWIGVSGVGADGVSIVLLLTPKIKRPEKKMHSIYQSSVTYNCATKNPKWYRWGR